MYGTKKPEPEQGGGHSRTDLALCLGLLVAILVFISVVIIMLRILRRKDLYQHHQHVRSSSYRLTPTAGTVFMYCCTAANG